jgi:hypothetical protein
MILLPNRTFLVLLVIVPVLVCVGCSGMIRRTEPLPWQREEPQQPTSPASTRPLSPSSGDTLPPVSSDLLPFTEKAWALKTTTHRDAFPQLGFGIGVSTYAPDFSGLQRAFAAVEEKYRQQDSSITPHTRPFDASPLIWVSMQVRPSSALAGHLELGTSPEPRKVDVRVASGSLRYSMRPVTRAEVRPYVGVGLSRYHFVAEREYRYGWVIGHGSNVGMSLHGGLELARSGDRGSTRFATTLNFSTAYAFIPPMETTTVAGERVKVRGGGLLVGAQMSFSFW